MARYAYLFNRKDTATLAFACIPLLLVILYFRSYIVKDIGHILSEFQQFKHHWNLFFRNFPNWHPFFRAYKAFIAISCLLVFFLAISISLKPIGKKSLSFMAASHCLPFVIWICAFSCPKALQRITHVAWHRASMCIVFWIGESVFRFLKRKDFVAIRTSCLLTVIMFLQFASIKPPGPTSIEVDTPELDLMCSMDRAPTFQELLLCDNLNDPFSMHSNTRIFPEIQKTTLDSPLMFLISAFFKAHPLDQKFVLGEPQRGVQWWSLLGKDINAVLGKSVVQVLCQKILKYLSLGYLISGFWLTFLQIKS
eukprot:GHVP01055585.1.p1 GENE.GHVP01055585.1~~GHVP01055585.1.p1  ORF type:complete len:309 (+),score=36.96 GHVP01055585.1:225-1151(+)